MNNRVYFVDDEVQAGHLFLRFCADTDFEPSVFHHANDALAVFQSKPATVIVTDLSMPDKDGLTLMQELRSIDPDVAIIIVTGYATIPNAIEAMKQGAVDFIQKPYDMEQLILLIHRCLQNANMRQENRLLKRRLSHEREYLGMVGKSSALKIVQGVIEKIADVRCHVIIEGESGTGKELIARAIHEYSQDASKPFVVIDCGAMTETLLESELFGHQKGAFTGAVHNKRGLLEEASGGTVFLDEICNISDTMQTRLLRVVQENQLFRVGGLKPIKVDLRFVAATNRNLEQMVADGFFREDLYHRLHVIKIAAPALRQRPEDIPLLLQHFIAEFAEKYNRRVTGFDTESMKQLLTYSWPGNVRELKNVVERHVALADTDTIQLQLDALGESADSDGKNQITQRVCHNWPTLKALEDSYIQQVLAHTKGNRQQAARLLGIDKSTLWRKLRSV